MEQAITKAIEGGWRARRYPYSWSGKHCEVNDALLDPTFWQALFKSKSCFHETGAYRHEARCQIGQYEWEYYWHRFIDHLIAGKSIDSFFKELLK